MDLIPNKEGKLRDKNGRFVKGAVNNPKGCPKGVGRSPVLEFMKQIELAKKRHKKDILAHLLDRAYKDDQVLIAVARKILPDKIEGDLREVIIKQIITYNQ